MKIRIKANSVRFRLTKTEVETFSKTGSYTEITHFKSKALTYALIAKDGITELEADFVDNTITIYFPKSEQEGWANLPRSGLHHLQLLNPFRWSHCFFQYHIER